MLILADGVAPLNATGQIDRLIPTANIGRIEVVGRVQVLFTVQMHEGGVVNIITKRRKQTIYIAFSTDRTSLLQEKVKKGCEKALMQTFRLAGHTEDKSLERKVGEAGITAGKLTGK